MRSAGLERVARSTILKTTTDATGGNWVKLGNANADGQVVTCAQVSVYNGTGTTLSFGYGGSDQAEPDGETFELPTATAFGFRGIGSCAMIFVRRDDLSNTQVTFKAVAEGV